MAVYETAGRGSIPRRDILSFGRTQLVPEKHQDSCFQLAAPEGDADNRRFFYGVRFSNLCLPSLFPESF